MDPAVIGQIASIPIAIIGAAVAIISSISANRASRVNTERTTRVDMEKEAYIRARDHDTQTIESLKAELAEERAERRQERDELKAEISKLKRQLTRVAAGLPPEEEQHNGST